MKPLVQKKTSIIKSELREVHLFQLAPTAGVAATATTSTNKANNNRTYYY